MEILHRTHNIKIAPRKLRLVADSIRYMSALAALETLPLVINKASVHLEKSLKSAVQVAKDRDLDPSTLKIQQIFCDEGMKLKRMIGHSRGRMASIHKHSSHLSIVLIGEVAKRSRRMASKPAEVTTELPSTVTA